jgi:hypothetical protein
LREKSKAYLSRKESLRLWAPGRDSPFLLLVTRSEIPENRFHTKVLATTGPPNEPVGLIQARVELRSIDHHRTARGNKRWVSDPSGISWETFHTFGESTVYGDDVVARPPAAKTQQSSEACCVPVAPGASGCRAASKAE